jgi:hypothetical protein
MFFSALPDIILSDSLPKIDWGKAHLREKAGNQRFDDIGISRNWSGGITLDIRFKWYMKFLK